MREGCLRAEGCRATAWLPIIGRALEVLCLRVRAWTCLDGVRRAALCAMPDAGASAAALEPLRGICCTGSIRATTATFVNPGAADVPAH